MAGGMTVGALGGRWYRIDPDSVESGDRIVLAAFKQHGAGNAPPYCYYADRLPFSIKLYTVLAVVACFFATPLALLCCIPIMRYNAKVRTCSSHVRKP